MNERTYTVGELARLSGVTVRTLHHYDRIGLLPPSTRSDAGYRLYTAPDLERLQLILLYRELGSSLEEVAGALASGRDRLDLLEVQRVRLVTEQRRVADLVAAVEFAIEAERTGVRMNEKDMFEVFGDFDPTEHADEARERWPDTYAESQTRTSRYSKEQWQEAIAEMDSLSRRFAALLDGGASATSAEAKDVAEEHRQHIDRWYYSCSHETHTGLADMYVADQRFTDYWESYAAGLAGYVHDAIWANATDRVG
jgi:DNA-binding transcriptional MerR regulator